MKYFSGILALLRPIAVSASVNDVIIPEFLPKLADTIRPAHKTLRFEVPISFFEIRNSNRFLRNSKFQIVNSGLSLCSLWQILLPPTATAACPTQPPSAILESLNDGTYFIGIDPDLIAGPFAELHGDPVNSNKITQKLEQFARAKLAGIAER